MRENIIPPSPRYMRTGLPGVTCFEEVDSRHLYRVWHEDWYCFCLVLEGEGDIRYRNRTLRLRANRAFTFSPGEAHQTLRIDAPGSYRVLMIPAADVIARPGRPRIEDTLTEFGEGHAQFASLVELTSAFAGPRTSELDIEAKYATFLDTIAESPGDSNGERYAVFPEDPRVVRDVREFLQGNADLDLKLADIAKALGWSPGYVSKAFSESGYCPPKTFLRLLRVERARRLLLADPARSIKNAALTVGFRSVEKFNISFRKAWNMTPSEYLATHRRIEPSPGAPSLT